MWLFTKPSLSDQAYAGGLKKKNKQTNKQKQKQKKKNAIMQSLDGGGAIFIEQEKSWKK